MPHATLIALLAAALALPIRADEPTWRDLRVVDPGIGDRGPLSTSNRMLPIDLRAPAGFDRVYRVPGSARGVSALGPRRTEEKLARVDGAITAVFSRSEYVQTKKGIRPAIPPGTIFYIGDSPLLNLPDSGRPQDWQSRQSATPHAAARPWNALNLSAAAPFESRATASPAGEPLLDLPSGLSTLNQPIRAQRMLAEHADLRAQPEDHPAAAPPTPRALQPDLPPPARNMFTDEQFRRKRVRALLMAAAGE